MVEQLLRYQHAGLQFSLITVGNESLITRARNSVISEFHARQTHSHLLFLDADVVLPLDGLQQMLASGVDVVGAAVALKGRNPDGSRKFNLGRATGEAGRLLRVSRTGTAALLLSRQAVDALVEKAIADGRVYQRSSNVRGHEVRATVHYDVFRVGVVGDEYLSEDYWVCHELRELGFEIHVDPTIVTRHLGMVEV
jgi:hypothetical protein